MVYIGISINAVYSVISLVNKQMHMAHAYRH